VKNHRLPPAFSSQQRSSPREAILSAKRQAVSNDGCSVWIGCNHNASARMTAENGLSEPSESLTALMDGGRSISIYLQDGKWSHAIRV
jgi:hypothetical protein